MARILIYISTEHAWLADLVIDPGVQWTTLSHYGKVHKAGVRGVGEWDIIRGLEKKWLRC